MLAGSRVMGRYSHDDAGSGLEFLGLITGSTPSSTAPNVAPVSPTPPPALAASWSLGLGDAEVQALPAATVSPTVSPTATPPTPTAVTVPAGQPLTRREARALETAPEPSAAFDFVAPSPAFDFAVVQAVVAPAPSIASSAAPPVEFVAPRVPTPTHGIPSASTLSQPLPSRRDARTSAPAAPGRAASAPKPKPGSARPPRGLGRTIPRTRAAASKSLSLVAMLFAGALVVGMSVPANAFISPSASEAAPVVAHAAVGSQSVAVADDAASATTARDTFDVISYAEIMKEKYGNTPMTFTPTTGAVRWPFPYSVPISDGWGARVAPCSGCSTFHQGVDFTPGGGSPIYAIADGVVTTHDDTNYGLGNNVLISHVINGQNIDSVYAHMLTGSSTLKPGDVIKVGDFIGLVGDTGSSTGNHLHFEIHVDKVPVDPFAWLTANAVN